MALTPIEKLFHNAATNGDLEQLKKIVNSKDHEHEEETTPLHKSSQNGHLNMVKFFIRLGADVEVKSKGGWTPLHVACIEGRTDIVKFLIKKGASVNAETNKINCTPLHCAKNPEITKILIDNGANVDAKDNDDWTPLHIAVNKTTDIVKVLLENGAQIDTKNKDGDTPLHIASYNGQLEIVKLLIQHSAQVDARCKQNQTPFDLADEKEHFEIAKYLLEKKKELQSNNLPNNISAKALCIICLTPRNGIYVLYPCGHTSLCEPCCYKLKKEKYSKCPSCRKPIKDYTKIFFQEVPSVSD